MKRMLILAALVLGAAPGILHAAPGKWQAEKPAELKAKMGKGKTLKTYVSPNRKYTLAYRDENEVGDFVWRSVYLKHPRGYTRVGNYNEVTNVRWTRDSRTVSYRAIQAVGPETLEHLDVEYSPGTQRVRRRVVKTVNL